MIVVIRISGRVKIPTAVEETLYRMRLRKKYVTTLLEDSVENKKLLESVRNFVSFGNISQATLEKLIEKRASIIGAKKLDPKHIAQIIEKEGFEKSGIKPFFRLHPPRGGIESKKHAGIGKGVLGHNKTIDKLVERML